MKHVFSMETEREKDLQTLAETIVLCQLKMKKGSCAPAACARCGTYHELERCMAELPACDSLRVKNMAQELYGLKEFQYGLNKPSLKESVREWLDAIGIGIIYFIVPFALCVAFMFGMIMLVCLIG